MTAKEWDKKRNGFAKVAFPAVLVQYAEGMIFTGEQDEVISYSRYCRNVSVHMTEELYGPRPSEEKE